MKLIALLCLVLVRVAAAQPSVQFEKTVRYREIVSGQKIEVTIHQRVFDFSKYKLTGGEDSGGRARLDGVEVAGTDGRSPRSIPGWPRIETIAEIELKWNDKPVPVSKQLHINLLNLSLRRDSIQFVARPSGRELLIQATGGDGGGSYLVSLVLRKNGQHKQYECGYCESGLRAHPYKIEEDTGTDREGRSIIKSFDWLKPGAEPRKDANPAKPGGSP